MSALYMVAYAAEIVRINPSTEEGKAAVARYGNRFWRRSLSPSSVVMLIPIRDGIPLVSEFIIVPAGDIVYEQTSVGYGSQATR